MAETIDKLYLELSNVTTARNQREINLATMVLRLARAVEKFSPEKLEIVSQARDLVERMGMLGFNPILRGEERDR